MGDPGKDADEIVVPRGERQGPVDPDEIILPGDEADDWIASSAGTAEKPIVLDVGPQLPTRRRQTDVASRDPLQAYMNEVSQYSLLTPEEERELAIAFREEDDQEAAYKLVTANLRLVAKIAFKYRRFYRNVLDLIQEGNIGLMKAVQKFDPYREVRLSTYARYWIQAYIMYFLLANHRIVKVGTTQAKRKLFYNLSKETKRLRDLGFDPTPQRIADSLDVDVKDVVEMQQRLSAPDASLDAPLGGEDDRTLATTIPSSAMGPGASVEYQEMMSLVGGAMRAFGETLTDERELTIWNERLMAEEPMTLHDIGLGYGVTRERARQIEAKIKKKLKAYLLEHLGAEVELSVEMLG
jgi:RNA polymerase sigma-32 factor